MVAGATGHQGRGHLARRQRAHRVDKQVGQARRRPQADLAALLAVAVLGQLSHHGGKGFAAAHPRERLLGLGLAGLSFGGAGAFGHGDQHLRDVQFGIGLRRGALLVDQAVDLEVGDADALVDLALADALDHHLVAQVGAKAREIDAVGLHAVAQLVQRQLVLLRDALHRTVEVGLVDLDAGLARVGDHDPLFDQGVQRLASQFGFGWQAHAGALRGLLLRTLDAAIHLAGGHQLLVDHGHDVVAVAHGLAQLGLGRGGQDQGQQRGRGRGAPAGQEFSHIGGGAGIVSLRSSRSRR